MDEFYTPTAEQFATWRASQVPTAVVRLMCAHDGHGGIVEAWRLPSGQTQWWAGQNRDGFKSTAIGDDVGPQRWQHVLTCPRPSCNYRVELGGSNTKSGEGRTPLPDPDGIWPTVGRLLDGLIQAGRGTLTHPSGAPAIRIDIDTLLQHRSQT